ncbi:MAG: glycosyltransferase [Candidatus Sericytochromatia bacterium]
MKKEDLEKSVKFIKKIEQQEVELVFLFPIGRSGSFLLQSLLDNHEEIITIPIALVIYNDWEVIKSFINDEEKLVKTFFDFCSIKNNLGQIEDKLFQSIKTKVEKNLISILKEINITRKSFIAAIHTAYAISFDIDLLKVKSILIHHHYTRSIILNDLVIDSIKDYILNTIYQDLTFLNAIKLDFENAKFLFTIRDQYDNFNSFFRLTKTEHNGLDLSLFLKRMYITFYSYLDVINNIILDTKTKYRIIPLISIHKDTETIMKDLSLFFNIKYNETLLKSTFMGKLWEGNSSTKNVGLNKNIVFNSWKENLTEEHIMFCNFLLVNVINFFDQKNINYEEKDNNINKFFKEEKESFFKSLFDNTISTSFIDLFNTSKYIWPEIYPVMRKNLFIKASNIDNSNIDNIILNYLDNSFLYKDLNISIQYKMLDYIVSNNCYKIYLQHWIYTYLTKKLVKELNQSIDQIWVMSEFTKEIYIRSGVIPNKIKVIHYGVNTSVFKNKTSELKTNLKGSFKFVFYSLFESEELLETIIESFCECFHNVDDISLIIYNKEYVTYSQEKKNILVSKVLNYINKYKLRKNTNINIIFDNLNKEENLVDFINSCNCFLYLYSEESACIPLLQAMSCEIPIITNNKGPSIDFCNSSNSFLVDTDMIESDISIINNDNLISNHEYFKINRKSLKDLMFYVYTNIDDAKIKAKEARKTIEENFTWEKTFNKINYNIEELKEKEIISLNLNNIKRKHEENVLYYLLSENFSDAELELETLLKYDPNNINYLYNLSLCYFNQKKDELCIDTLSDLMDISIVNFNVLDMMSKCLFNVGEKELSQIYLEKSKEFLQ